MNSKITSSLFALTFLFTIMPHTAATAELVEKTVTRKVEDAKNANGYIQLEVTQKYDPSLWRYEKFKQKGIYPGDVFICINPDICRKNTRIFVDYWKLSSFQPYGKKSIAKIPLTNDSINRVFVNLVLWKVTLLQLIPGSINNMVLTTIAAIPYVETNITTSEKQPRKINGFLQLKNWGIRQYTTIDDSIAILTTVLFGSRNPTKSPAENNITPAIIKLIENRSIRLKKP